MADEISIVVRAEDQFSGVLGNFGSIITGIESAINLVKGAFDAAIGAITPFIDSASESEQALSKLNVVLASMGGSTSFTSAQMQDMAIAMMDLSGFSDEAEMAAEAMLLRFENLNSIFPEALQLTNDLAVALGQDLTTAARVIGMALDDPASGIGRLNMQFRLFNETEMDTIKLMAENGDIAGAQALIMERLREKVGGAAEAFGDTFAGKLAIATEKLDNLKEIIGNAFLPMLTNLLSGVIDFVSRPEVQQFVEDFAQKLSDIFATLANYDIAGKLQEIINAFNQGGITAVIDVVLGGVTAQDIADWTNTLDAQLAIAISNHDWTASGDAFGQAIANALTAGSQAGVDSASSQAIPALAQGIVDWFLGAVGSANWDEFSNKFVDILQYYLIEWPFSQIKTALTTPWIYELGHSLGEALLAGLESWRVDWNAWWDEHLVQPLKDFLGISSPSTVFYEIGRNLIQGLINGIGSMWDTFLTFFTTLLSDLSIENITDFLLGNTDTLGGASATFGGFGGGTTGGTTGYIPGGESSGQPVTNNYYGPVYFVGAGEPGAYYDCPQPNPLVSASGNSSLSIVNVG